MAQRSYTDPQLRDAVVESQSWRGVLRALGLLATSAGAMRSVRAHADRLGLDYSHFRGQRGWTEEELAAAVSTSSTWAGVADEIGLLGGSATSLLKGHAARLGLDTSHLSSQRRSVDHALRPSPRMDRLARAGSMLAAAWFTLGGADVSWPLEPARYDLLAELDGQFERIQVKTATVRSGDSWQAWLSRTGGGRTTYDPDEIDYFFIIDGELSLYLIPVRVVGGLHAIRLSAYRAYRVHDAATGSWALHVS